jgi:hypothetical protein
MNVVPDLKIRKIDFRRRPQLFCMLPAEICFAAWIYACGIAAQNPAELP